MKKILKKVANVNLSSPPPGPPTKQIRGHLNLPNEIRDFQKKQKTIGISESTGTIAPLVLRYDIFQGSP